MNKETLLIHYFEGTLTNEEKVLLFEKLENDAAFKAEFEFQKNVKAAIKLEERKNLKEKLIALENQRTPQRTKNLKVRWISIAASFVVFASVGYWILSLNSNDSLYEDYYETFPNVEAPTVRGSIANDIKSEAFYAYDSKNYEGALHLFSEILDKDKDDYALFYKGLALMELERFNDAVTVFESYQEKPNSAFNNYIKWYLALCYIKTNQTEKSKNLAHKLIKSENPFQNQARDLLRDLE
ncbi:tetratricopeptide repeat protein [Flavobacterium terrae]|uniref:Tetratricopeptide repeat-containing protein n=1 Tax=Flavobacterium terrae TaxID=415425 RepID=A0A1M6AZI4_9FLAO|nr:tetratricopeptide repeat protein [Flavobacterium terrae]SHI41851.1 Tetratricopeptide repeat-containing protein [Flavobacterium terrae]